MNFEITRRPTKSDRDDPFFPTKVSDWRNNDKVKRNLATMLKGDGYKYVEDGETMWRLKV